MAAKVTKTRWTLSGALISTLTGTVAKCNISRIVAVGRKPRNQT
ncbi:MAG: hypothetical protein ACLRR3_00400 [Eubacterium sp.]